MITAREKSLKEQTLAASMVQSKPGIGQRIRRLIWLQVAKVVPTRQTKQPNAETK